MQCNSPASLKEGMKRCPVDIEGKGAGWYVRHQTVLHTIRCAAYRPLHPLHFRDEGNFSSPASLKEGGGGKGAGGGLGIKPHYTPFE